MEISGNLSGPTCSNILKLPHESPHRLGQLERNPGKPPENAVWLFQAFLLFLLVQASPNLTAEDMFSKRSGDVEVWAFSRGNEIRTIHVDYLWFRRHHPISSISLGRPPVILGFEDPPDAPSLG